jgi:hypothetical protein
MNSSRPVRAWMLAKAGAELKIPRKGVMAWSFTAIRSGLIQRKRL